MRILFLNPGGNALGGAERSLTLLINGMAARDHAVFAEVLLPGDAGDVFAAAGATVIHRTPRLDRVRRHGSAGSFAVGVAQSVPAVASLAAFVQRDARRFDIDIIHSNGFRTHLLAPLLRSSGRRLVWSLRDRAPRRSQRAALILASHAAHAVVANSEFTADQLRRSTLSVDVVPNPVTPEPLVPRGEARAALSLPANRAVIAVVAHLDRSKGHHVAIEAMAAWQADTRPCLVIAGGNLYGDASVRYEQELRALIKYHHLENDVLLIGGVPKIGVVYASANLVVQPAIYPEGFGRVVAEAQLAGIPVIATALGGARELIRNGASGILIPPNDPTALRSAAAHILGNPPLAARLVKGGLSMTHRFSPDSHVEAVEAIYRRILTR